MTNSSASMSELTRIPTNGASIYNDLGIVNRGYHDNDFALVGSSGATGLTKRSLSNNMTNLSIELDDMSGLAGSISPEIPNMGSNCRGVSVTPSGDAVVIRNAIKSYGSSSQPVLSGLNMTVPCGSMFEHKNNKLRYGLLGSSGCGKTTVLSSIVGIQKLDQGRIWVFGERPGTKCVGVPGRNVGYMPQDISLYSEFSIEETFNYFGTLNGMFKWEIEKQREALSTMLSIPWGSRRVGTLSGGQQRRVSLVVALLSNPELLILDEPTAGVDPLIRQKIWNHLKKLSLSQRTTVIITTHYIEECRMADNIGFMRSGRLIVERETTALMASHGSQNLEKIVLDFARGDADIEPCKQLRRLSISKTPSINSNSSFKAKPTNMAKVIREPDTGAKDVFSRIRALTGKNFVILFRNPLWLFFVILCAAVIGALANVSLGQDPRELAIGIINGEVESGSCGNFTGYPGECFVDLLSCQYLGYLDKNIFNLKDEASEADAKARIQDGTSWGYMIFSPDFSTSLYERYSAGVEPDEEILNSSEVIIKLDETSQLVSNTIKVKMLRSFEAFVTDLLGNCGFDRRQGEYSLNYKTPIFGSEETNFREFMAPGAGIALLFFFPIITTSIRYIKEKKSGVLDRSLVGGVKTWEIMVAYSISEFFVLLLQSLANYFMMTRMFGIKVIGWEILVVALFLLSGYVGVSMGFLLGSICTEEIQAAMLALAAFFPNLLLSGDLWPREGMFYVMQYIVAFLPCTLAGESARSITSRGWEFSHPKVWPGFAVLVGYIVGFFILTMIYNMKFR